MDGKIECVRYCKVIDINDDTDADRIKVRISPEDNSKTLSEIDYAFPLLPKMFHVKPKLGEMVLVLLGVANDGNSQRYYIGPVISQDHRIYNDPFLQGADAFLRGSTRKFDVAPSTDPLQDGILPNDDDVVIRGRKNADIQISDDDVRIKAGVKVADENFRYKMAFNRKNPAYLKLKYHPNGLADGSNSTATIAADKINILSNRSSVAPFNLTDKKDLITDEELENVIQTAYRLPYGEKLIEYLKALTLAFETHTHDFSMLPPNPSFTAALKLKEATLLDNKEMLSDGIRIN